MTKHAVIGKKIEKLEKEMSDIIETENSEAIPKAKIILETLQTQNTLLEAASKFKNDEKFQNHFNEWLESAEKTLLFDIRAIVMLERSRL